MIYKYTKCEAIIAKIMADGGLDGTHMRTTDIREWIFEAVDKIGAPVQYIEKESGVDDCPILKIEDYQVPIPDDLERLSTVAYSTNPKGPWVPVLVNDSSFKNKQRHPSKGRELWDDHHFHPLYECCEEDAEVDQLYPDDIHIPHKPITSHCQLYSINGMKYLERHIANGCLEPVTFFIKPGWIVLNRKKGFVKLAYRAIATDERGYPLIPDLTSYQEAVYWYVMMKLSFPKFLSGKLGGGRASGTSMQVYSFLQQQWNFYRNQAYAECMMPNESEMRNIKNEWNKLVPEWDSDEVFFKPEGKKQLNYHDYYHGY